MPPGPGGTWRCGHGTALRRACYHSSPCRGRFAALRTSDLPPVRRGASATRRGKFRANGWRVSATAPGLSGRMCQCVETAEDRLACFCRKRGRVVDCTGLENRRRATVREFESHRFRQNDVVCRRTASHQSLCNPHEYWLSAKFIAHARFSAYDFIAPELMGTMMSTESGGGFQWDARPKSWDRLQ